MAAKFLGQFLFEQGLIDRQQLLDALEAQRASNPLLGELAQASGMLDAAQAEYINERQRVEDKRFGDIAVAAGLLTSTQVDALLDQQRLGRKMFGAMLIEQGALSPEQLANALHQHQHDRDDAFKSLETGLADHPAGVVMNNAIDTCKRLFPRLLKTQCQFSHLASSAPDIAMHAVVAHVRIQSLRPLLVAVACDTATATRIGSAFLSISPAECDASLAEDALGELVNVLMGYVVKDALPGDAEYRAEPPQFDVPVDVLLANEPEAIAVTMTSQLGAFVLLVAG